MIAAGQSSVTDWAAILLTMIITSLSVHHVRSHTLFSAEVSPSVTVIIGRNGAGKTSLLEALYVALRGTSFRGTGRDMIQHSEAMLDIKATLDDGSARRGRISLTADGKLVKSFTVSGRTVARLTPAQRHPVVLFEPDELRLLSSSPARRRDFIDGIIARLSPTYATVLSRYSRTLAQRNELLKQFDHMAREPWESHLFAWDVKLSELGTTITNARTNFLSQSNQHLTRLYQSIAGNTQHITASYYSAHATTTQQALLTELESRRQSDAITGATSIGPHRDDITISLDDAPAAKTASRGEARTIMLAFKLLEVELQEHHSGQQPLVLLDDVFSELDVRRETALMKALSPYQTIITATDIRDELVTNAKIISLE
jgi:DNA replication and repair protein RecF